jgi:hypothetical protein
MAGIKPITIGELVNVLENTGSIVYTDTKLSPNIHALTSAAFARKFRRKDVLICGWIRGFGLRVKNWSSQERIKDFKIVSPQAVSKCLGIGFRDHYWGYTYPVTIQGSAVRL